MCEEDAIHYDGVNVVVEFSKCSQSMDCIAPCPTGAIDHWRMVETPYSIEDQFDWEELPEELLVDQSESVDSDRGKIEADTILATAHTGEGGKARAPDSASHPVVNMYTRSNPAKAIVQGNYRITDPDSDSDVSHIVLDLGAQALPVLEGQSMGVVAPGKDGNGREHTLRLYSVASPRDGERPNHNNVSFTVKRVVLNRDGGQYKGVASNYLCDLKRGDEVRLTGPYGTTFLMPDNPQTNLIMICTGTGAAPFRAMTERRRRTANSSGQLLLFFGARTPGELPYFGPLMKLPDSLIQRELAFSRLPEQAKEYVQDRMRKCADEVASLLKNDNTYVYVCGLKAMEHGVDQALDDICLSHGTSWGELKKRMRDEGRFHVETYE